MSPSPAGRPAFDPALYLVTDQRLCGERGLVDVVGLALRGGVSLVQLREKRQSFREMLDLGLALMGLLAPYGVPLIINDRVDVALAVNAHGVHLGQSDMPVELARQLLGPTALIGLSVETLEQLRAAEALAPGLVDYYGVSPVFATPTKTDTGPGWGLAGLGQARALVDEGSKLPLVAIGGIHAGNAAAVVRCGASGVAVVSALCAAPDPLAASAEILAAVRGALG